MRDGLELISLHYSQAWNCQLYDSHLIRDVFSASSHHIKAGVTFFTTLTKCKFLINDHWDTEGNLIANERVPKSQTHLYSEALVRVRTSSHFCSQLTSVRGFFATESLQPTAFCIQTFLRSFGTVLAKAGAAGDFRKSQQAWERTFNPGCYWRQKTVFITSVVRLYKAIDRLPILGSTQRASLAN